MRVSAMRFSILRASGRNLARGCAVLMVAGTVAGCSSQVARFADGLDTTATASTPNQRSIINKQPVEQPYPGDTVAAAPVDGSYNRSITRSSLEPVQVQSLPPVAESQPASDVAKPAKTAAAKVDQTVTGTVAPANTLKPAGQLEAPKLAVEDSEPKGWSRAGGTQITVREGETVYNLSRRFGVPADVIMKTNGLATADGLQAGQKLVIPTYVYSAKAPVSAPDNDPKVANARSSKGSKSDLPEDKAPVPSSAPAKVAVLPQQPKVKDGKSTQPVDAVASDSKAKQPAKAADVASAAPAGGSAGTYTVQQGDTLSSIARKTGVSVVALKQANGMQDGLIRIGQTLKVPAGGAGAAQVASAKPAPVDPVKTGSTPPPAKATPSETLASYTPPKQDAKLIRQAESEDLDAPDSTGIGKMRWPARGRIISGFGSGKDGIDIAVPAGTPIKAAENGVVIYAGDGLKEFGNTVLVRHDNGLVTVYGHASSLDVKRGQKVKRGQQIALSGMSGTTDTPKLHFEVRKNSAPVDPSTFLE
jgi:murein DD-endopeptidase MepM/ murein hydrolase activator NlpD